eukprot:5337021-Ditylum_brightwellii.AAC.1
MSTYLTEEVQSKSLHKTLLQCNGKPNYDYIHEVMMALYGNAVAVPTTLGGGAHGHIGLVIEAGLYGTFSGGTAYNAPQESIRGQLPAHTTLANRENHKR